MSMVARCENPFTRRDRIHFPAISQAMWECSPHDPFGTPEVEDALSPGGLVGWTPASFEMSRLDPQSCSVEEGKGVDAYFADRERRGLLTPARSPSDLMRRGSLFDPNHSGSSQNSGPTPSSISGVTEDPTSPNFDSCSGSGLGLRIGHSSQSVGSKPSPEARSPMRVSQGFAALARTVEPGTRRSAGHGARQGASCMARPPSTENRTRNVIVSETRCSPNACISRSAAPSESKQVIDLTVGSNASPTPGAAGVRATTSSPVSLRVALGQIVDAGVHETDSLSASSISFGREDARVRGGDGRDAAAPRAARAPPGPSPAAACPKRRAEGRPQGTAAGSVARQLDFGVEANAKLQVLRANVTELGFAAPPNTSQRCAVPATPSFLKGSTRQSPPSDDVDWSLSCDISPVRTADPHRTDCADACSNDLLLPSPTLAELSPLRSPEGDEENSHTSSMPTIPADYIANPAMTEVAAPVVEGEGSSRFGKQSRRSAGRRLRRKGSPCLATVADVRSALRSVQALDVAGSADIVLQLRLCDCGRGFQLIEQGSACSPAQRIEKPIFNSLAHESRCAATIFRRTSSVPLAGRLACASAPCRSLLGQQRSSNDGSSEASLDGLQSTLRAMRARYLEHFLLLRPWRHLGVSSLLCSRSSSFAPPSDHCKQRLHSRRRLAQRHATC